MTESIVRIKIPSAEYQIRIGAGNLNQLPQEIDSHSPTRIFILFDENVEVHLQRALTAFADSPLKSSQIETFKVPSGEGSKCIAMAEKIWEFLAEKRADRRSIVVAFGGGVVGDLAGYVAASYARGIRFYQVPTTLLAHVDSSVGGKTGINLASAKNMVGAFWQPEGVLIDIQTLTTLDQREYRSGLAEVIKYGLIMDEPFFEKLESNASGLVDRNESLLIDVISHCCRLKAQVVEEDEKETSGRRAILNYGHTFAHAFETEFGYGKYLHGEAVAVGMLCAADLAFRLGRISSEFCERQKRLIEGVGLPVAVEKTDPERLIAIMKRDKKNVDDRIRFILPNGIGSVELVEETISSELITKSIEAFLD